MGSENTCRVSSGSKGHRITSRPGLLVADTRNQINVNKTSDSQVSALEREAEEQ